ncbi:hypothetical protein G6F43_012621 [Rhizopus delemar]|nr:hypothetical protein G6F43_012621 [Rhizopus delemar]
MDVDRMDVIFRKRIKEGLTIQDVEYLSQSNRTTTHKAYDHGWRIWTNWCKRNGFEPQVYNPKAVYWFLNAHNHLSTPTLNVYRSSIASVFNIIHEKRRPIAEDPLIASFFQAKRKSEVNIPRSETQQVWNIQQVITHVRGWGQNEELDIAQLQKKTVIWIGIATMMRPRSDLGRLQYQDVEFKWTDDGQLLGVSLI